MGAAAKAFSLGGKAVGFGSKVINTVMKSAQIGDNICNVVQVGMAVKAGTEMIGQGNYLGGVTLLGLGALGAKGSFGGKANRVSGEIAEDIERGATKTTRAAERVGEFTDKVAKYASDAKVNITNTFDNATVTFAHAMGFGDNVAFAGGTSGIGKSFNHVDDALGKTVAKVEGKVDGVLDEVVEKVVQPEKISDELWDTHINSIHEISNGQIKGGHNFDSIVTEIQEKYGLSDDDVSKMLISSKEIIPPGGIHEITYQVPQLPQGQTWKKPPVTLKRDTAQEVVFRTGEPVKTVFDPAVYDPNAIRAGMDDALANGVIKVSEDDNLYTGVGKVFKKDGTEVKVNFEFRRDPNGNLTTAYPVN